MKLETPPKQKETPLQDITLAMLNALKNAVCLCLDDIIQEEQPSYTLYSELDVLLYHSDKWNIRTPYMWVNHGKG